MTLFWLTRTVWVEKYFEKNITVKLSDLLNFKYIGSSSETVDKESNEQVWNLGKELEPELSICQVSAIVHFKQQYWMKWLISSVEKQTNEWTKFFPHYECYKNKISSKRKNNLVWLMNTFTAMGLEKPVSERQVITEVNDLQLLISQDKTRTENLFGFGNEEVIVFLARTVKL